MAFLDKLKRYDNLYFMLRNKKVLVGGGIFLSLLFLGLVGPLITKYGVDEVAGPNYAAPTWQFPMGTDNFGHDVLTLVFHGLRSSFVVGFLGGTMATVVGLIIGFFSGYKGKTIDEALMMLTNVMLVIPTLALLIVIGSYISARGIVLQSCIIAATAWPWAARAVRAQTLSIRNKEFVNLSRITSYPTRKIILEDIATNMMSYCFMVFILQFNGAILASVGMDFLGLGPTKGTTLGLILFTVNQWNAVQFGYWWWVLYPGLAITLVVTSLYLINIGMDEVFNPRLREM